VIGKVRTIQLEPEARATALRIQKGIDNLLIRQKGLLEQLAESAGRNAGLLVTSDRLKDVQVLPDGNLQIVF
jgi:hypothetical protein